MAAARFGDANENGNDDIDEFDQLQSHAKRRLANRCNGGSASAGVHHAVDFKLFTRDSLANIQRRKNLRSKKQSIGAFLDPARQQPEPDPYLASGQQLPPALIRQLPPELVGKPIEDIDPFYADQETFVIISRGKEITRFSANKALYILGPFHPIRRIVLYILVNSIFNLLVILTILTNCILMTIQGSELVEKTEIIFTIVYTTEMGFKVLARGFIMDQFTYLRDPWNWLDFSVIIMAYLTIVVEDLGNLSVMRTFRVLRALKTVAIIPGMKTIVGAVIDSVKNLKDVVVLTSFSLSVFSLLGLQIYMGLLTQKCILNGPSDMSDSEWHAWCSNSSHWVPEPDDEIFGAYRLCGNATGAQSCPPDYTCLQGFGPNPDYGYTNFDTFGWALICSFRLMTQDFWEGLYMQVLKTAGSWHIIFFIVSIFLGSIYLMNLILAIVAMSYNELQRRAEEEEEAAAEDEAAFLESCRRMEMQERLSSSDQSNQTSGARSSYRPSVEIGLVGQSLLASLCQNGLLGQRVRDKLNRQMIFPGIGQPNVRSHSLSANLENREPRAQLDGEANMRTSVTGRMPSADFFDRPSMAVSMTELRRKSSVRTSAEFGVHLSPTRTYRYPISSTGAEVAASTQASLSTATTTTGPTAPSSQPHSELLQQSTAFHRQHQVVVGFGSSPKRRYANKLSPHYVSSGVLMPASHQHLDSRDSIGAVSRIGRRSPRTSTTSDRDLQVLKQRAALIRIVSDDCSTNADEDAPDEGNNLTRDPAREIYSFDSPTNQSNTLDDFSRGSCSFSVDEKPATAPFSSYSALQCRRSITGSIGSQQRRLRVGEAEKEDSETPVPDPYTRDSASVTPTPQSQSMTRSQDLVAGHVSRKSSATLQLQSTNLEVNRPEYRYEPAICHQPHSILQQEPLPVSRRASIVSRRKSLTPMTVVDADAGKPPQSLTPQTSGSASGGPMKLARGTSTKALNLAATSGTAGGDTSRSTTASTNRQLGVDVGRRMHHLSVENFQQFSQNIGKHTIKQTQEPDANTLQPRHSVALQPPSATDTPPLEVPGRRRVGGHEGRGSHIHPSTMVRSSFSRPRQSIAAPNLRATDGGLGGDLGGAASARRVSRDFVRRASDWSRLSMSTNVDLRRLLRLWSHTNPYNSGVGFGANRSSFGSMSNYSQTNANPGAAYESYDAGAYAANQSGFSSHRPSSVGSSWQAYELMSAMSRRQRRYGNQDPIFALPLDDDLVDKMSVTMRDKCIAYCLSCLDILCIWECCGAWLKIQHLISLVVFDPFTELFIILCILINTLFMALDSDDADAQMKSIFERGNYFFTATFAVEASMKIMALSPKFYFREGWNVFDSIIVGLSLLELGLEGVYGLSVLRSFRLLRVFKLAKSWPTLNLLISIMGKAVGDLGNLTFVLAIIVFIFAVMGMQLFGNKYVDRNFPSGELPRWNFTDFMHSFMIVFRILCAEWIEPMWDCLLVGGWPCIPFFLIAVTVGNLVVLNLFLALLLASFGASNLSSPQADNVDTKKLQEAIGRFSRFGAWSRRQVGRLISRITRCLLGKKKKHDGISGVNNRSDSADSSGRPIKSHIASMSRLERLKNIELKTEQLKVKIRRSPEHHYHLKQLAKSQVKAIGKSGSDHHHHLTAQAASIGYNYQYKTRSPQQQSSTAAASGTGITPPMIPIIVNEPQDNTEDAESDQRSDFGNSDEVELQEVFSSSGNEIHNDETRPTYVAQQASSHGMASPDSTLSDSRSTRNPQFAQISNQGYNLAQSSNPCSNNLMQPIKEDPRDQDLNGTVSCITVGRASDLVMSKSDWHLQSKSRSLFAEADEAREHQPLVRVDTMKQSASCNPIHQPTNDTMNRISPADDAANSEPERPRSSLYLKAPKREDMEEEDEKTLQHIETYIEKCICIGILCLKWFLFRKYVRKIVEHKYFDQCILVLIIISSGTLALEDKHLNERPTLKRTLDVLDTIFTIVFSLEMVFKWLAFGVRRYFGNIWSWLDFVIVLVSFVNLMASIFGSGKIQALKTMRTLRAMRGLRPLRALQRFQGMRVVVNALIQAIPSIFNVLLVCLIFWLIFSIMGVQMFGGKFWRCLNPETKQVVSYEEAANRFECLERNLTWANPQINFDNVLNAYLALFQVATFKGWIDIMNSATDSRNRDDQPIREANIYMYFYFVFFVIFGSFFTLNLFIGVIIDNFNEQKKKTGGSLEIFMTDDQKKYYHAMKKMRSKRPVKAMTRPKMQLQAYMFDITTSKKFDMAIMLIIGLNMFVMALEHYGQSQDFSMILENLNLIFIAIFTLECLCKIFAMRHFYFREPWNIFDFIVVALSILGVVMKEYVAKYFVSPTLLRVVRVVKVGRVLRLVKGAKGIRTLLFALAMSLPALFNICLLLFLVMFIYAIFGMSFFMNVRRRSGIDETFNFDTFTSSIIVLFQMSTSAGWDLVLDPLMDEENDCQKPDPSQGIEGTCGNRGIAIFYLISYVIVTFLIIINMYIAVILENYSQATEDVQEGLTDDDYEMYYEIWQKFDPDGTQYLPLEKLSDFVDALEDPLRIPKPNDLAIVILDINIYEGDQCYCVDILDALTKYFFTRKGLVIQVNEHLQQVQSTLHETPFERITTTYMLKRQHYCAKLIQNCWRKWKEQMLASKDNLEQRPGSERSDNLTLGGPKADEIQ